MKVTRPIYSQLLLPQPHPSLLGSWPAERRALAQKCRCIAAWESQDATLGNATVM